jgi:hypothetical protein
MNELDLFIAANAIADPAERAAYLVRVGAEQPELRRRLEALLAGNERSRHPLDQPPSHPQAPADATCTFGDPAGIVSFKGRLAKATPGLRRLLQPDHGEAVQVDLCRPTAERVNLRTMPGSWRGYSANVK